MPSSHDSRGAGRNTPRCLPLLPLRDIIVFPGRVVRLFVGRDKSIQALEQAMNADKDIALSAQIKSKINNPTSHDIYSVGTVGRIVQLLRLPDGTVRVLVEGRQRLQVAAFVENECYFEVDIHEVEEAGVAPESSRDVDALLALVRAEFEDYVQHNKRVPPEMIGHVARMSDPGKLADLIAGHMSFKLTDKQLILEAFDPLERLEKVFALMQAEREAQQADQQVRNRVKRQLERPQRENFEKSRDTSSRKSWSARRNPGEDELEELEARIAQQDLPEHARERLDREMSKLKLMGPMSAEATVLRNYIDWVLALPWGEMSEERLDLSEAEEILERDHFGLQKPKERILEHLAVQALVERPRGPILCFVGPPGVGKTSLGRSIARATGRHFVRLSLGGVRDEAEIRGHRRTYIGAMPGKLIQALRRAEASNPVLLLDEIDKMSTDFRGDPSAALLEVLDPEQNSTFSDHYLDLDYDLSRVMFICTANDLSAIPGPLRDRMEVIELSGYTDRDKLQIARRYLVAKQQAQTGTEKVDVEVTDAALTRIIHDYTREAGVRGLERQVGAIFRKIARRVVGEGSDLAVRVDADALPTYLGAAHHQPADIEAEDQVGLTHGLAWTQFGGVLLHAEATVMAGSGKICITGKLGEVMQESARAAITWVRTRAENLGLSPDFHERVDFHVHFPQGALPKDGPSAGITMATSLVSALTQIAVRRDVAMTGEITLLGRVLAVGGLKEKLLAAHRAGIRKVIIPHANLVDLDELPDAVRHELEVVGVRRIDEALGHALDLAHPGDFLRRLQEPASPFYSLYPPQAACFSDATNGEGARATQDGQFDAEEPPSESTHLDDAPIH